MNKIDKLLVIRSHSVPQFYNSKYNFSTRYYVNFAAAFQRCISIVFVLIFGILSTSVYSSFELRRSQKFK